MSDYERVRLQYAGVSKTSNGEDTWCPSVIVAQKYTPTTSFVLRTGARNFLRLKKLPTVSHILVYVNLAGRYSSWCGLKIVQTSDCAFEKDLRDRLEDRAQTPPLFCELPGEAHARQGDRFLAAGDCVELAPFEVVGHAGDVGELPLLHRPESSAESPHLRGKTTC